MSRELILAIDQGTTGTTALLTDSTLQVLAKTTIDFPQVYPRPGWVEHRADDIWRSINKSVSECLARAKACGSEVKCIGIANQRETATLFDSAGTPVHNFIVWQCRRSSAICEELKAKGLEPLFRERTGLLLDPYFSATKLMWLLREVPGAADGVRQGKLHFGTIDTWILQRMSGGRVHATDATNASRTLMMNIETLQWEDELLEIMQIPADCLPRISGSSEVLGHTQGLDFLPDGIPICALAGDQQSALFGQACLKSGEGKVTFGTGAFILMHTGERIVRSSHGLLTSVALKVGDQTTYCIEGSAFVAGAAVQWVRDGLGIIETAAEIEELAKQVADSAGVSFVPALVGLGAPHWKTQARGLLCGVSRGTTKAHIARAVLEGIALQNCDIMGAMAKDGVAVKELRVDGGASANDLLMQMQADFLDVQCLRPSCVESTAIGAAALAGLAMGLVPSVDHIRAAWKADRIFEPSLSSEYRLDRIAKWHEAVAKA